MKDIILKQLKERAGLSEESAEKAAKVVMDVLENHGGEVMKFVQGKLGDSAGGALGGALGGLLGGDKK